jgi:hypothetical protein
VDLEEEVLIGMGGNAGIPGFVGLELHLFHSFLFGRLGGGYGMFVRAMANRDGLSLDVAQTEGGSVWRSA